MGRAGTRITPSESELIELPKDDRNNFHTKRKGDYEGEGRIAAGPGGGILAKIKRKRKTRLVK